LLGKVTMKNSFRFAPAFLYVVAFIFSAILTMHAQDYDSVRVVRVSRVEGQVLVSHAGGNAWEEALVNLPLEEGDTLATQSGLAEVEFENGATSYLAENSTLQFTQVGFSDGGGRATELTLTEGTGTFYANLATQDSFRVATPTFSVAIAERAEFRVDVFKDGAAAEALLGTITVSTTRGSTQLEKEQSVAVHEKDSQDFSIGHLPDPDAFDQWVTEEGEIIRSGNKNTLSYISSPNYYGLSDLSLYGTWVNFPGFGLSWQPFRTGLSWAPYMNGIWILDARLGWIWVSNEPWGWMPYHFGTWQLSPTLGCVWIPGGPAGLRRWEPARVNWVRVGNQVGWVAKSPNDRDGAPANIQQGVITRPGRFSRAASDSTEILTGKALQSATPVKQPPQEFASRPSTNVQRSGIPSAIRPVAPASDRNASIVFDRSTHTFINRDRGSEPANESRSRATLMPRSSAQTGIPSVTIPSAGSIDSRTNRVLLPPAYPVAPTPRANVPGSGIPPARVPAAAPNSSQRNGAPSVVPPINAPAQLRGNPGPVVIPPSPPPRPVAPPPAPPQAPGPHPAQNQLGSAARPAAPSASTPEQRR
jgi:hypothetical protein